jgi:feruloyl-CoA synthase
LNRDDVGVLVYPRLDDCRRLAQLPISASASDIINAPEVRAFFSNLLEQLNRESTGSATAIARLWLLDTPPSLDRGEITDKGSINQRAVLSHYEALIEMMHNAQRNDPLVIYARNRKT